MSVPRNFRKTDAIYRFCAAIFFSVCGSSSHRITNQIKNGPMLTTTVQPSIAEVSKISSNRPSTHSFTWPDALRSESRQISEVPADGNAAAVDGPAASLGAVDVSSRFGLRLREMRRERNLTQLRMAREFGIDRSFISDVERGRKSISLPMLEVIALGMKVSLSELLKNL
jgi:DNA-binding XRE family transcriptional regulator